MRAISAGLEAHKAQAVTTLATIWKVTRTDGQIFGFTDHDQDLEVGGLTYAAATGYRRSAVRAQLGLNADNAELAGALQSAAFQADDIRAGIWDYAAVEIYEVNWADLTQGTLYLNAGKLGKIKTGRGSFTAELLGLAKLLEQSVGRVFGAACDATLGDTRCGVSLAPFTRAGTVRTVTSRRVFGDHGIPTSFGDGYFNGGLLTWTGGNNAGLEMEVKTFLNAGGAFALQLPMPYAVQVGDTFSVVAGCDKTLATCKDVFSNVVNFRGFPFIPGPRRAASGGR